MRNWLFKFYRLLFKVMNVLLSISSLGRPGISLTNSEKHYSIIADACDRKNTNLFLKLDTVRTIKLSHPVLLFYGELYFSLGSNDLISKCLRVIPNNL